MKHFEIEIRVALRLLHANGTNEEIVGIARIESFAGGSDEFKEHYEIVGYEVGNQLRKEFDKAFPKP